MASVQLKKYVHGQVAGLCQDALRPFSVDLLLPYLAILLPMPTVVLKCSLSAESIKMIILYNKTDLQ